MSYSPSETLKNIWSLLYTKLFFRPARLVRRPIYIRNRKAMTFGKGFTTGYHCRFDLFGNDTTLHIGKNCKIGDRVHIVASENVTIGDDCLMASHIFISDTNHGSNQDSPLTPPDNRPLSSCPVTIGDRVWLGESVCVLPGARIGDGCIIGAHAVVKGCIPPNSMAVGAPAKVVKIYNFENHQWERC